MRVDGEGPQGVEISAFFGSKGGVVIETSERAKQEGSGAARGVPVGAIALACLTALVALSLACSPTTKKKKKKETPSPTVTPTATYPYWPIVLNSFESEPAVDGAGKLRQKRVLITQPLRGYAAPFAFRTDGLAKTERTSKQFFAQNVSSVAYDRPLAELKMAPPRSERTDAEPLFPVHGDHGARVWFSVPPDYLPESRRKAIGEPPLMAVGTPGTPAPLARHEAMMGASLAFPSPTPRPTASWIVAVTYPDPITGGELALPNGTPIHDLRPFHQVALDVLNPDAERFEFWVRVTDGRNHWADFPVSVSGTSLQKVSVPIEAMRNAAARGSDGHTENARLNLEDIRYLSLVADTSLIGKDRAIYIDALRLEIVAPTPSATPSQSPWSFRRDVLGIGKPTPTRTPLPEGEEPPEEETPAEEETPEEGDGESTPEA